MITHMSDEEHRLKDQCTKNKDKVANNNRSNLTRRASKRKHVDDGEGYGRETTTTMTRTMDMMDRERKRMATTQETQREINGQ